MGELWANRIVGYGEEAPDQLLANPRNFRIHPKPQQDALLGVLREVGVVQDVLVNKCTGFVVDGHLRISLALREKQLTIPVKYVELSEDEEALILATFDPIAALAVADKEKLDALLRDVSTGDAGVQQMLADMAEREGIVSLPMAGASDDDVPALDDGPTRVQPGEIWRVGPHTVACLDSTDRENVEQVLGGRAVGMIWADPPYGISAVDVNKGTLNSGNPYPFGGLKGSVGSGNWIAANQYAPVIGDSSTTTAILAATTLLALYSSAVHIWWGANHYADRLPPSSCWIVWDKREDVPSNDFADGEMAWCNQPLAIRIFRHLWSGLMKASERGERRVHPTQKPVALCLWAFEKYGKSGDVILDPFLGSGPSLKAAHRMGNRTVIGFELSPHYCDHVLSWAEAEGLTCERETP